MSLDPAQLLAPFIGQPLLLAAMIIAMTFLLEDATALAAGALAAAMAIDPALALGALLLGTILGDLGLHLLGRAAARHPALARRLERRLIRAAGTTGPVAAARFVPGLRLPAYLASGIAGMSIGRFLLVSTATGLLWTPALFFAGHRLAAHGPALSALALLLLLGLPLLARLVRPRLARWLG